MFMTAIYIIFTHKKNLDVPQQMIGYRKYGVFEEWNITQTLKMKSLNWQVNQ